MSNRSTAPTYTWTRRLSLAALYAILIFAAILALLPLYWMVISSLKPLNDIITLPVWIIPTHPGLQNYQNLLQNTLFARSILNTLVVAGTNVVIQTLLCSLAGFGFAKYR